MARVRGSFLLLAMGVALLARDARAGVVVFTESEPPKGADFALRRSPDDRFLSRRRVWPG